MIISRALTRLVCAAAITAFASQGVAAETVFHNSISYYQIGGKTADDLDRELSRRGPYTEGTGSRHPGATEIKFGGELTYVEKPKRCEIGDVKVTLTTRIILPRWKNRRKAGPDIALVWDALSSDIKRHEERHAEIARQHARRLEKSLKRLRPMRDCDLLEAKVAELSDKELSRHDKDQRRFDRVESINFEKRITRIIDYRAEQAGR
ncbi:DUF922 domain-containing Zn-dependent protease [Agrobacterium sp. ES01]|uniref:DUF922 domain-containing Zn-dependent protease n=1 Tax=Agrobacterium sp. ES01 TaxID=3420714 RepID=UPI003D0A793D